MKDFLEAMEAVGLNPVVIDENTEFPAPSQFLPGTKIQFAWDSTCLGDLKKCPRYYELIHIEGWVPKDQTIHLRFGIEYHQALHDYETYRASEYDHEEALRGTVKSMLTRLVDYPDVDPTAKPSIAQKNKRNLVRTVIWYLEQFQRDNCQTVMMDGNTPALEVSFKFPLDWGPGYPLQRFEKSGEVLDVYPQHYLLCGHLDRVVTYNDETFVMDRKTTTTTLSQHYFAQYEPNNQMSLYTLAGKIVLGTTIRGVIIDAATVQVEGSWFQRGFTYRTQDQLDEWLADLHVLLAQAESYAISNYWPQNDTACDKFGGCQFRGICSKSPAVRERFLAAGFVKREEKDRWNPLKPR